MWFVWEFQIDSHNGIFLSSIHRYEDICPSTHNMDVPHVKREDYQLTDISDDGYLTLMTDGGDLREDLKIPDGELGNTLRSEYDNGKELLVCIHVQFFFSIFCRTFSILNVSYLVFASQCAFFALHSHLSII